MKPLTLSFMMVANMVMASLNDLTMPSDVIFTRSLLSVDENDLFHDTSNIVRRGGGSPSSAKVFSPSILRAQDAAAASDHKSANAAAQQPPQVPAIRAQSLSSGLSPSPPPSYRTAGRRAAGLPNRPLGRSLSSPFSSPPGSPPTSPPTSPRTAGRRADEAERTAAQARNRFHNLAWNNTLRRNLVSNTANVFEPHEDFVNKMALAEWEGRAADFKLDQTSAYINAANAARKAGRQERHTRNSQKATASRALAQDHLALMNVMRTSAVHEYSEREHAERLARSPDLPGGESSLPTFAELQESRVTVEAARSRQAHTSQVAKRLRNFEGGMDTQSSSSDSDSEWGLATTGPRVIQ